MSKSIDDIMNAHDPQRAPNTRPEQSPLSSTSSSEAKANDSPAAASLSADQIKAISEETARAFEKHVADAKFEPQLKAQVLQKDKVKLISDFSNLSEADIYNLDLALEAKPFMDADVLKLTLKDSHYVARWVNKMPMNLGMMLARGFTYIEADDLIENVAMEVTKDAEDHYAYHDVVAMKIDKTTYWKALRDAHQKASARINAVQAQTAGENEAASYMRQNSGHGYEEARNAGLVKFYRPDIGI